MKKILCFTLILITLLSFAVLPVSAASTIKFKFTLNPDKKSYTVSGDSSYTYPTSFTIPSSYNGKPVTIIDEGAFAGCSSSGYVKAVTIPASVETIGNHAFCEFDGNGGICPKTIYILNKDVYFGYHAIGYYVWGYYSEDDVFSHPTFYGYPGSTTEKYCAQETSFTFKSLTLSAPKLTSTKNGKGYVTFKWEAVSGADSYLVYHKEGSGSWVQLGTTTSTSFKDTKVTSGKKYTYTVKAHNKYGYGTYNKTGIVSGYTNAPVLKSAAASSVGITVKWNAVTGATGYNIYRKAPGASSWTKIGTSTTTSYGDTTVKYGSSYTYTIIATVKFDGKTYNSTYDSTGLTAKASKVITPAKPTAAVTKKGTVTVKWDKIQGATKYTVYRSEKADSGFQTLKTVTSTSYADATVKLGKTYYYKIVAYIGSNKSSASKACSIAATIPVPAVKNYVAVTTSSTKLYWDKVADATGYFIYRRVPGGSWSKIATIKNNSNVNYTDKTKGTFDYLMCAYITSNG
ncbi:MAG: hypothetical protein MJ091_06270, partial [Clostridia bacterium]|nr:hypothetical protein [Clostridia bacterium]